MIASQIVVCFAFFGLLGWVFESTYCSLVEKRWCNRGFLFGPVCPIYGAGAVAAILVFGGPDAAAARLAWWVVFLACAAGTSCIEWVTSVVIEQLFGTVWWDYSDMQLNLRGRVCVPVAALFGLCGLGVVYVALPLARQVVAAVPPLAFELAALALTAVLAGCSGGGVLSSLKGGSTSAQSISRPAVESAELQFTHPAAGDTIAVFDTSAGVFKAVLFSTEAPQAVQNFTTLAQQGFYNGLTVTRAEKDFVVEAGQGADGKGTTIWNGNRFSAETTDKLHHYSGALCAAADASGDCASVFYVMETLPGSSSVTQELIDQMNAAGWRADVVSAYQTAGGAPYLDYTDTVFGQVYEGMEVVDTIAQTGVDETQRPTEAVTINSEIGRASCRERV